MKFSVGGSWTGASLSAGQTEMIIARLSRLESWSGEFMVRDRRGREFPVMAIDSPIAGADGALAAVVGVSFDLSDRRAAQETLRVSEERYRNVIDGADEIIFFRRSRWPDLVSDSRLRDRDRLAPR